MIASVCSLLLVFLYTYSSLVRHGQDGGGNLGGEEEAGLRREFRGAYRGEEAGQNEGILFF